MLNVLNTQLFRMKKSKLFWAMFIVCAVLPLLGMALITSLVAGIGELIEEDGGSGLLQMFRGEGAFVTLQALSGGVLYDSFPAFFALITSSIFLSGEFTSGAIRNMVLANKSRTQIFLSFFSVALIIGFSYFGVWYASSLLCFGLAFGFKGISVSAAATGCLTALLLGLLTVIFVQACVCFFLFITRKTGGTVAFPLLIILLLPSIINGIVNGIVLVNATAGKTVSDAALSWIPMYNLSKFNATAVDGALVGKIAMYNALLAAIFAFFGWLAIDKADLK